MKPELNKLDRLMLITALSGLVLVALTFLLPNEADAKVAVRARSGPAMVVVAPDSNRDLGAGPPATRLNR